MDKRSRQYRIFKAGDTEYYKIVKAEQYNTHDGARMLRAFAAMLDEALKQPGKVKPVGGVKLNTIAKNHERFMTNLMDAAELRISANPWDTRWPMQLRAQLNKLEGVILSDATLVGKFIADKGWWRDRRPTLSQVIKNLPGLIAAARGGGDGEPAFSE